MVCLLIELGGEGEGKDWFCTFLIRGIEDISRCSKLVIRDEDVAGWKLNAYMYSNGRGCLYEGGIVSTEG